MCSTYFRKKAKVSAVTKIRPMGAEFYHADGRTDITKLIVAFRNSAKAPQISTAFRVLFDDFKATTLKYSCFITANILPVLTVWNVLSLLHIQGCNNARLIAVIKYIITGVFQTASFLPANYWRTVIRPLLHKIAVHKLLITFNI